MVTSKKSNLALRMRVVDKQAPNKKSPAGMHSTRRTARKLGHVAACAVPPAPRLRGNLHEELTKDTGYKPSGWRHLCRKRVACKEGDGGGTQTRLVFLDSGVITRHRVTLWHRHRVSVSPPNHLCVPRRHRRLLKLPPLQPGTTAPRNCSAFPEHRRNDVSTFVFIQCLDGMYSHLQI